MYRNGKVWAEVDDAGELVVNHGVVKIRYRQDDTREYSVRAADIQEIDEHQLRRHKAKIASYKESGRAQESPRRLAGEHSRDLYGWRLLWQSWACWDRGPDGVERQDQRGL